MLASKRTLDEIYTLFRNKELIIETKYDGERIQCHFNEEQISFFTRNSNNYTHIYGPKMSQIVRDHVRARAAILDGEMIVVDTATRMSIPFGMNKPVALAENNDSTLRLCYKVFDLLYVKGKQGEEVNLIKTLKCKDRKRLL